MGAEPLTFYLLGLSPLGAEPLWNGALLERGPSILFIGAEPLRGAPFGAEPLWERSPFGAEPLTSYRLGRSPFGAEPL